ncbi:hypothetical protein COT99_03620, partial [Candidatus Falkowbacteria bacterium CG10_big_fil_rev_8_21_14_0_10_43_10]
MNEEKSTFIHVCPSWTAGPRSAHPKFGGGVIIGGIPRAGEDPMECFARSMTNFNKMVEEAAA